MPQKIINVKPIKSKEVLNQFATELYQSKNGQRDLLIFKIGITTGLRISDILNLKVSDVRNKIETEIIEIKTKKVRQLNLKKLTNDIITYLADFHDGESEWLFYSPRDHAKKLSNHHYYLRTKDLTMLMKILNHSSQSVTLRYIGLEQEEISASLDDFDPLSN